MVAGRESSDGAVGHRALAVGLDSNTWPPRGPWAPSQRGRGAGLQELRVLQVIRKPICHLRAASEVTQLHVCRLHGQTRTNVPKGKEETWLQRWAGSGRVLR